MLHAHASSVVSVVPDLFDISIHFFFISPITLLFLLLDAFNFHEVVDKYPAYSCLGPWLSGRERASHRLWAQRPLPHRGLCRIHPGVFGRATVPCWLRLRWRHHGQDAPQCVPKTSRPLWIRRLVVQYVVVSQWWKNEETRCLLKCRALKRNSGTHLWESTD